MLLFETKMKRVDECPFQLQSFLGKGTICSAWMVNEQQVLKVFPNVDEHTAFAVFKDPERTTLTLYDDPGEGREEVDEISTVPGRFFRRMDRHETFIHQLVGGDRWGYYGVIPFQGSFQWKHRKIRKCVNQSGILMPRAEGTLLHFMKLRKKFQPMDLEIIRNDGIYCDWSNPFLGRQDLAVIVFQLLVSLHRLQEDFQFLHLDLHNNNIFIFNTAGLPSYPPCCFEGYELPSRGLVALIGDFNLSSVTYDGKRHELLGLEFYNHSENQNVFAGHINACFEDKKGYDTQYFLGIEPWRRGLYDHCSELKRFWKRLEEAALGSQGTMNRAGRPHIVSQVRPLEILQQVFGNPEESWYDFRKPVPRDGDVSVACV